MAIEEIKQLIDGEGGRTGARDLGLTQVLDICVDSIPRRKVWFLAICLALGNAADAVEIICVGYIMTEMDGEISRFQKELLTAAVFMGMLIGGLGMGYLADVIGRKVGLIYSLALNVIAGFVSAAVPNVTWLIVTRIVAGLGIGGSVPIVFSLGAELFPSNVRGKMLSVIASFWMVGAIYVALIAWLMLGSDFSGNRIMPMCNWRWFAAASALPALTALICAILFLEESPRYLIMKGKYEDAAEVLSKLTGLTIEASIFHGDSLHRHKQNSSMGTRNPLQKTDITHRNIEEHARDPAEGIKSTNGSSRADDLNSIRSNEQKREPTIAMIFGPSLRKTTITLMAITSTLSFSSYGISTWISELFEDVGISNAYASAFIFALANFPGNAFSIIYIEQMGRRRLLAYGMTFAAISAIGFAIDKNNAVVVVICASLFNAFSVAGWNALDCLQAESFPTVIRTSGMGILSASARIGAIIAQFVNGSLEQHISALLLVTSACTFMGGICAWTLPNDSTGTALSEAGGEVETVTDSNFGSRDTSASPTPRMGPNEYRTLGVHDLSGDLANDVETATV